MTRFACGVEYDGSAFSGWQRQTHAPSIQDAVETAFSAVAYQPIQITTAGRTDSGVHATGQVIHFDTEVERTPHAWQRGAGSHLPPTISIGWVQPVPDSFHARHTAIRRHYRYILLQRRSAPGLLTHRVSRTPKTLDAARMQEAAQALLGTHDFSSFRAAGCQAKNPTRTLHRLNIAAHGPFVHLDVEADSFLHNMVRILVGSLMCVGDGQQPIKWISELLHARDRTAGGVTAPPDGLYLVRVHYPSEYNIPQPLWIPDYRTCSFDS